MSAPAPRTGTARVGNTAEIGLMVEGQEALTWERWTRLLVMVPFVIGRDDTEVGAAIAGQRRTFAGLPAYLHAWVEDVAFDDPGTRKASA